MNPIFRAVDLIRPKTEKKVATYKDVIMIVVAMIFFSVDFVLDIILAVRYFLEGNVWFFILTVCCMFVPALILTVINIWWFDMQSKHDNSRIPTKLRKLRNVFIFLMMAPLLRNIEALYYAIKSIKVTQQSEKKQYYLRMIKFIAHAALLTLLEAFMECGPQVLLQLYIFAQTQASNPNVFIGTEKLQVITIFISLVSMSYAYASYQHSSRLLLDNRGRLSDLRKIFLFFWRFFEITSRVIALGLFASVFPYYLLLISFGHFLAMFCWVHSMKTHYFHDKFRDFIYNLVFAEVFVFFFFNPKDDKTRLRYTVYYILVFLENTALSCLWFFYYSPVADFRLPVFILQFLSFAVAVVLLVVYLYSVYPTLKINSQETVEELENDVRSQPPTVHFLFQ